MINKIADSTENGFEWFDLVAPNEEEFAEVAKQVQLLYSFVRNLS